MMVEFWSSINISAVVLIGTIVTATVEMSPSVVVVLMVGVRMLITYSFSFEFVHLARICQT